MAGQLVVVTGVGQIDRRLSRFSAKVQKKVVRSALNNAVKKVHQTFNQIVPVDTGAMKAAAVRKAAKLKKGTKGIGRALVIDRNKLAAEALARGKETSFDAKRGEPYFYPAFVELGTFEGGARAPLRASLYGNETQVRNEFHRQLKIALLSA